MRGKLQHSVSHLTNQACFWMKVFFIAGRALLDCSQLVECEVVFLPPKGSLTKIHVMNNANDSGAFSEHKHVKMKEEEEKKINCQGLVGGREKKKL